MPPPIFLIKPTFYIMKILCLDQSTRVVGYSLWEDKKLVDYGHLTYKEKDMLKRMEQICRDVTKMIVAESPVLVVIEGTQNQMNNKVFGELSQLQGVLFSIFFNIGVKFEVVHPKTWKSFCGVKGAKRKEQKENTRIIVKEMFGIEATEDEADAIGIGICVVNNLDKKEINGEKE